MTRRSERGATVLEVTLAGVLIVPLIGAAFAAQRLLVGAVTTNSASSDADEALRRIAVQVERVLRPGLRSSCEVRATQGDVDAAIAAGETPPAIGDWIPAADLDPRPDVRFQSASGTVTLNAADLTSPRSFRFDLEASEVDNGIDDDGDGLVDEGELRFDFDGQTVVLQRDLEACAFSLDGQVLQFTLSCAHRDKERRIYRATTTRSILLRNS